METVFADRAREREREKQSESESEQKSKGIIKFCGPHKTGSEEKRTRRAKPLNGCSARVFSVFFYIHTHKYGAA